jgi:hypothetical protein
MDRPAAKLPSLQEPAATSRSWGWWLLTAALVSLSRPSAWPIALAAFLLRGGIVALALPLLVLPTPSGIADVLYPSLRDLYLGNPSRELVLVIRALAATAAALFLAANLVAAWLETELVGAAADDEEAGPARVRAPRRRGVRVVGPAFVVRLVAHVPLVVALVWGVAALGDATYRELIRPTDAQEAILLRVLASTPGPLVAVAVSWLAGEVAGGLALRRVVLHGEGVSGALRGAWRDLVAMPRTTLGTLILTDGALAVGVVSSVIASALAAERLRITLGLGLDGWELAFSLGLFVGLWLMTLVLAGLLTTFRSIAWTFEEIRRTRLRAGAGAAVDARGTL